LFEGGIMKKYAGIIVSLVLFVVTGLTHNVTLATAVNTTPGEFTETPMMTPSNQEGVPPTEEIKQKVEYTLPYPGILPDHPLYNLKRFRDYVLERLISDPVRKTEFYMLQGDKRLAMGMALAAQGKGALSESTISKGEKYMEKAVSGISALKTNGGAVPPHVVGNLENSLGKHAEVVTALIASAQDAEKAGLNASLVLVQQLLQTVAGLR
jgi:hypothetical protein